jgi:hypothetical protein
MASIVDISPAALGTSVSLAAAGLALITQWRVFRTAGQRRFRDLEERGKAVAFWTAWAAAQKAVAVGDDQVNTRLTRAQTALDELADFGDDHDDLGASLGVPTTGLRHLLLIERPHKAGTWPLQALFYLAVAGSSALIAVALAELRDNLTAERAETFGGVVIAMLLLLALLRQFVLLIDGKAIRQPARKPVR